MKQIYEKKYECNKKVGDCSIQLSSLLSFVLSVEVERKPQSIRFLSSMKIGTTRGLEVTRMSHGWAQQAGKNNMTVGPCKGGAEPCKYRICHKNSQDPKSGPGPTPLALCLPTKPPNQSTPQPPVMLTSTRTKSMSEQTHTLIEAESGAQVFP